MIRSVLKYSTLLLITLMWQLIIYGQQAKQTSTAIFWDSSSSMADRNLEKEFEFLEAYFTDNPACSVTLVNFSNAILRQEKFQITQGHWGLLKERLTATVYDGGTSYEDFAAISDSDDILIFTDGHQNVSTESPYLSGNVSIVNSRRDFNRTNINLLAILSRGTFYNLIEGPSKPPTKAVTYSGVIQGSEGLSYKVEIGIKGKEGSTIKPDINGSYAIEAEMGEVLVVTTDDGKRLEKPLGKNKNIDIWISTNEEIKLEEVVVTGVQEEKVEEKITAYGTKNTDAVGYAVQSITEDQISDVSTTVNNATQGKFSGVRLGQNDDLSQVIMRPSNSLLGNNYGLIVVDGVPLGQSNSGAGLSNPGPSNVISKGSQVNSTAFLDPKNIADITVLKGLAATNRYGSMGANGVILIRTKTGTFGKAGEKKDLARLNDNIYEGKLKVSPKTLVTPYLKALKGGEEPQGGL